MKIYTRTISQQPEQHGSVPSVAEKVQKRITARMDVRVAGTRGQHPTAHFNTSSACRRGKKKNLQVSPALTLLTHNAAARGYQRLCPRTKSRFFP